LSSIAFLRLPGEKHMQPFIRAKPKLNNSVRNKTALQFTFPGGLADHWA
jgi:hypothetical protein